MPTNIPAAVMELSAEQPKNPEDVTLAEGCPSPSPAEWASHSPITIRKTRIDSQQFLITFHNKNKTKNMEVKSSQKKQKKYLRCPVF